MVGATEQGHASNMAGFTESGYIAFNETVPGLFILQKHWEEGQKGAFPHCGDPTLRDMPIKRHWAWLDHALQDMPRAAPGLGLWGASVGSDAGPGARGEPSTAQQSPAQQSWRWGYLHSSPVGQSCPAFTAQVGFSRAAMLGHSSPPTGQDRVTHAHWHICHCSRQAPHTCSRHSWTCTHGHRCALAGTGTLLHTWACTGKLYHVDPCR